MVDNKKLKIAALVTARGKNTLSNKHMILVDDKPLVWYPITVAKQCPSIEKYYISSDDANILKLGEEEGYQIIKRPEDISLPTSLHVDAITHALESMAEKDKYIPDILVVLLGNTVYFKSEWIEESIKILSEDKDVSAVVPAYLQNNHHPYRAKYLDSDGYLKTYFDFAEKGVSTNRQDLPENYFLCHNFWVLNVEKSIKSVGGQVPWVFMGEKIRPLILSEGPDVHEMEDIDLCQSWLEKNK